MLVALGLLCLSPSQHKPQPSKPKPKAKAIATAPQFDPTLPITIKAPKTRFETMTPLPGAPSIIVDGRLQGGIANQVAKNRGLQARILWIDATANLEKINTEPKIVDLVRQIKQSGFNTVVLDVKPLSGQTLYPSRFAPKLEEWRGKTMPVAFDPLRIMVREAKINGLSIMVSMNAFCEGHQLFHVGPGYDEPDQQTVLYEPRVVLKAPIGTTFPCSSNVNVMPDGASEIGIFNDARKLPAMPMPDAFAVSLAPRNRVVDGFDGGGVGKGVPTVPKGGAVLVGRGLAGDFLRRNATPGSVLLYEVAPSLVPIGQRPNRELPLMMNPNDERVQQHLLDLVREVVSSYAIDGIIYDDRLRYAGMDGDFSPTTEKAFEEFVGRPVQWPTSIYSYVVSTNMRTGIEPGPEYDAWMVFRTLTIRNFLARVRRTLKTVRPGAELGVYAGSWYGEYPSLGSNWGSPQLDAGFWFLTDTYKKTGFAPLLDFLITGCYYQTATIHQAMALGNPPGSCVEAAGALSNHAVRDSTWCYAGIALSDFKDDPDGLMNALSAACSTTQGVMVFDLSHDIDPMWPVFARAFSSVRKPPQLDRAALGVVRRRRAALDSAKTKDPTFIILSGSAGTGQ